MEKKVYLIYSDSNDDACSILGYIYGTEEDADACCREINKDAKYEWECYYWEELVRLNQE